MRFGPLSVVFLLALAACRSTPPKALSPSPSVARPPEAMVVDACPLPVDEKTATREDMIGVKVVAVCFRGRDRLSEAALAGALDTKVGSAFQPDTIRGDIQNLFSRGGVEDVEVRASLTPRGVALVYTVRERRPVIVKTVGGTSLSDTERTAATALGEGLDLARVRAAADALTEACQKRGKRAARVLYEIAPSSQGSVVTFVVEDCP
jgi:outer membrane protein assembly factor BamA